MHLLEKLASTFLELNCEVNGILRDAQHDDSPSNAHTTAKLVISHRGLDESGFEMYKNK